MASFLFEKKRLSNFLLSYHTILLPLAICLKPTELHEAEMLANIEVIGRAIQTCGCLMLNR